MEDLSHHRLPIEIGIAYISLSLMKAAGNYLEKAWNSHWSFLSLVVMACITELIIDSVDSQYNRRNWEAFSNFRIESIYREDINFEKRNLNISNLKLTGYAYQYTEQVKYIKSFIRK